MNYPITTQTGYRIPSAATYDRKRQQHLMVRHAREARMNAVHQAGMRYLDSPHLLNWRPLV